MKKLIVQNIYPHYRKPFFSELEKKGIDLFFKKIDGGLFSVLRKLNYTKYDEIIIEHSLSFKMLYYLIFLKLFYRYKIAYFGHYINFNSENTSYNFLRKFSLIFCSRYYAYNSEVKYHLKNDGFKNEIICFNNTVVSYFSESSTIRKIKSSKKIEFAFIGRNYPQKKINDILSLANYTKSKSLDWNFKIITDSKNNLKNHSENVEIILGTTGQKVYEILKNTNFIIVPGLVGLVANESFNLGCPIIAFQSKTHSPEFYYLENGINSIIIKKDWEILVSTIISISKSEDYYEDLCKNCLKASQKYSMKQTVNSFSI